MRKLKLFLDAKAANTPPRGISKASRVIFSVLTLLLLSIGQVWAADYDLVYTLDGITGTGGSSAYDAAGNDVVQTELHWAVVGNVTTSPWRIGGKGINGVNRTITGKSPISGTIVKIDIDHGAASNITVNSVTVEVATDADFTDLVSTLTPTFVASSVMTIEHPSTDDAWEDCYYRITYNLTNTTNSNRFVAFNSAKFYKEKAAVTTPTIEADIDEIAFGTKNVYEIANQSGSLNIAVEGVNLTGNITAVLSGDDAAKFSISGAPFAPTAGSASGTLVVSYEVTEAGDYEALVTLSSEGAADVELPISLSAVNIAPKVYEKVLSDSELSAGDKIVIINEQYKKAAGAISGTLLSVIDITAALDALNGKLSITDEAVQVFTLGGEEGAWTLTSESGQLSSTEAKKVIANGTTTWTITISSGDAAPVSSTAAAGTLQYNDNSGNGRFTTYTSNQKPVQFYKESDGKEAAGLAYAAEDAQKLVKVGADFTAPTLTNPNSLTVAYTSSDANVVAVNETTGALTIKAAGVAVITASFAGNDTYKAGSASYTIGVTAHAGTEADPYNAADVKTAIDVMGTVANAYASGIVSSIYSTSLPTEGYISFYFSADGATTGQQIEAYKCYGLNSAPFAALTDVKTGATVVITGTLKKFNSTYEFDANCHLVSYEAPAVPKTHIGNDQANPYTVAQAIAYAADGVTYDLDDYVYVQGVVYDVKSFNNGAMNIFIKDANAENQFELYKCAGINDGNATTQFEALTDVQVGNIVIGYGQLTVFNSMSELKQGNYLVDLQKPATGIELDATAEVEAGLTVNLTATILPSNATGTIAWTVQSGNDYASVENGVVTGIAEGEAVIRATVQGTEIYAECTVTVTPAAAPVVDTRMVAESPEEGFSSISGNLNSDISFAAYKGGAQNEPNGSNANKELRLYKYQATTDFGGYVTINAKKGFKIDQVIITVSANAKVGYCKDAEAFPTKESTPISIGTSTPFNTGTGLNAESVNVVNIDGSNQFKITHITVYYTGEAEAFTSYELSGEYATEFQQDAEFNHDNLVVYGVYADNSKVDITADCSFSTPDMSQTGEQTITITYKEQDIKSYTINVAEVGTAVVKFFAPASWEKVYICTWDGTTGNHEMEDAGDGWYSYELQKGTNYLFYTGENIDNFAIQTVDLYNIQAPLCYAWTNNWDEGKMQPVVVLTCEMNYYLSGESFPNGSWDADAFALDANNQYVFNALPAGTYSFKVTNGTWDWNLGYDNRDDENSNVTLSDYETNIQFTTDAEMNVTIAYNPATAKISVNAEKPFVPNIQFGKNVVKINNASINGNDSYENTWNVASVFGGDAYFNNYENPEYAQVGSGNKPVSSVTFTTTLPSNAKVKDFAIKLGGFNDTEGTITLKVGETVVGSGSLNGAEDVVISANNLPAYGNTLTIEATELNRLKVYGIAYSYEEVVKVSFFAPYDETNKWQTVYAYAWEYDAVNEVTTTLSAAWPGEDISASKHSGWYDFYVKKGANVIFNDNNFQTYDLNNIEADVCYVATAIDNEAKKVTATESANCDVDYYIADAANGLTAADWNAAAEDGKLVNGSITFQAVPAGTYEFKLTNGSWAWSIGRDNLNSECTTIAVDGEYSNVRFQTTQIQDITISYDAETGKICLDADVVKFDATIASIADQNIFVGEATTIARPVTDPEDAIIKYEVVEGTAASIDNDGKITGLAAGDARVRAYIEETETHHSAETFFYVHATCKEVVSTVVILAQLSDDSWIAMNHDMKAVAVDYHDGKIFDLDETDQETIKWTRTELCDVTTFQNPADDMYLLGNTGGTGLSLAEDASSNNKKEWVWNENENYYHVGEATRTFLYQGGTTAAFKNYAVSNAYPEKENYSTLPIVVVPEFATTPVEPEWETVRGDLEPNRYYTICFNKTMTAIQGASLWSFCGKDANMAYIEQAEAPYTAGTPYLIYAESDKLEAMTEVVDGSVAGSNNGLYGTFSYMDADALLTAGAKYMLKNNELRPLGSNNHLDAYRAYIILDNIQGGEPAPAPGRRVRAIPMQQNGATGFENIEASEKPMKLMIDGKIYILRGEKMYDATGRLVK